MGRTLGQRFKPCWVEAPPLLIEVGAPSTNVVATIGLMAIYCLGRRLNCNQGLIRSQCSCVSWATAERLHSRQQSTCKLRAGQNSMDSDSTLQTFPGADPATIQARCLCYRGHHRLIQSLPSATKEPRQSEPEPYGFVVCSRWIRRASERRPPPDHGSAPTPCSGCGADTPGTGSCLDSPL